jgi:hypothetical protein
MGDGADSTVSLGKQRRGKLRFSRLSDISDLFSLGQRVLDSFEVRDGTRQQYTCILLKDMYKGTSDTSVLWGLG